MERKVSVTFSVNEDGERVDFNIGIADMTEEEIDALAVRMAMTLHALTSGVYNYAVAERLAVQCLQSGQPAFLAKTLHKWSELKEGPSGVAIRPVDVLRRYL